MISQACVAAVAEKYSDGPRLLADIGGTNARFTLETGPNSFDAVLVLPCRNFPTLQDAIVAYLATAPAQAAGALHVRRAALAIANPIQGDFVRMTNHSWSFSIDAMRAFFGLETLLLVNDFSALAMALAHLSPQQRLAVGGGAPRDHGAIGLIGAGTGLGVSGLIAAGERWIALDSEGGHVGFSPVDEREIEVLRFAWREYAHVSAERLLSGSGLELIYRALASKMGQSEPLPAAEITRRALEGSCVICLETVECFCAMLGTFAGNLAVTLGAQRGVYVGGGIVPRLGRLFMESPFRERFEQKGRFSNYLAQIPTYVITAEYPAFIGCSVMLTEKSCMGMAAQGPA